MESFAEGIWRVLWSLKEYEYAIFVAYMVLVVMCLCWMAFQCIVSYRALGDLQRGMKPRSYQYYKRYYGVIMLKIFTIGICAIPATLILGLRGAFKGMRDTKYLFKKLWAY